MTLCFFTKTQSQVVDSAKLKNAFRFNKSISGDFTFLDVDVFGNLYVITKENQLKKINANGDSIASYNNVKKFGNPTSIDVSNPFRILVFYKSFSTIVILDQLLTFRGIIDFKKINLISVKTVAASSDNNAWIFDDQNFTIKKIDDEGNVLVESNDLRQIVEEVPEPIMMFEYNKLLYLFDQNKGLFVFDIYGAFKIKMSFTKNWKSMAASNNCIYGFNNNYLSQYELSSYQVNEYLLPDFIKNYQSAKFVTGKLYLLKKEAIEIYDITR